MLLLLCLLSLFQLRNTHVLCCIVIVGIKVNLFQHTYRTHISRDSYGRLSHYLCDRQLASPHAQAERSQAINRLIIRSARMCSCTNTTTFWGSAVLDLFFRVWCMTLGAIYHIISCHHSPHLTSPHLPTDTFAPASLVVIMTMMQVRTLT